MKKLLLNHPALKGLLMLLTILFAMPQAALAQTTYKITTDGKCYAYYVDFITEVKVTEAAAGKELAIRLNDNAQPDEGKYFTGEFLVNGQSLGTHGQEPYIIYIDEFTMPAEDVTIVAVQAEKTPLTFNFATSEPQEMPYGIIISFNNDDRLNSIRSDMEGAYGVYDFNNSGKPDMKYYDGGDDHWYVEPLPEADAKGSFSYDFPDRSDFVSTITFIFPITLTANSTNITLSQPSYEYDGTAKQPTVKVMDGETEISSTEYTVSYSNNTDAGTATVTITDVAGGNYIVNGSTTFTIAPKAVTVKADKKKKYAHDADPELTATVSGLIDADKDKANIIAYTLSRAEGEKTGTYDITPSGDAEQGNYSVTFESAKLYILHAPSPYGVWVNEIAVTADNRLDILGDGDAANKKAPSVQYFEDGNVLVLTNATVETIESEGDLEVYMAPESQNTVGSITRGINDPEDPDENIAQSRSAGEVTPVVGGKTTYQNSGKLRITSDHNFNGYMTFHNLTGHTAISGYSEIVTGGRLITFDAAGNVIAAPASATQEIAAVRADATPVTRYMAVGASTIADAVTKADVAAGANVEVGMVSGGKSESGEVNCHVTAVNGGTVTGATAIGATGVTVHMQNYGQEGGDAVKTNENGETALSFMSESGLIFNQSESGPDFYMWGQEYMYTLSKDGQTISTTNENEKNQLVTRGWTVTGGSWHPCTFNGAIIQIPAGRTDITIESGVNGNAELGAVISASVEKITMLSPGVGGISGLIESEIDGVCTIRSDVKVIGSYAFRDHTSIKELILSDEVEKICSFAFENCTNLKRISRSPKSKLNTIEACAFIGCVSLTDFDLTNVSNIAESAFSGCSNFDVSNNKGKKNNIYMPVAGKDVVSSDGRKTTRITVNTSEPSEMVLFKGVPAIINNLKTRGDGDNAEEESELLIYNIQIEPKKIYACNSIAEVTGGEYVGLEYLQQELPGQKVTGDDADLPKPGDVNGDDVVNAVDIVMTIDHINGGFSATFCKSAANLKADDTIDQADVDEMVKLILNQK